MKQSLAIGWLLTVVCLAFIFLSTACGRLTRSDTPGTSSVESPTSAEEAATINLNTASAADLEKLPGVGPALAKRIIAFRDAHGPFRRAEHVMMVQGVSDRKFRALRTLIRVE